MALIVAVGVNAGPQVTNVLSGCFSIRCSKTSGSVAPYWQCAEGMRPGLRFRQGGGPGSGKDWTAPNDKNIPMPVRAYPLPSTLEKTKGFSVYTVG